MRHGNALPKLNRDGPRRLRLLRNMASFLFQHEQLRTTLARAKELSRFADKLITLGKRGTEPARKALTSVLRGNQNSTELQVHDKVLTSLAERYRDRPGGYTRVWRAGLRPRDKAPAAIIELVDNPHDLRRKFQSYAQQAKPIG